MKKDVPCFNLNRTVGLLALMASIAGGAYMVWGPLYAYRQVRLMPDGTVEEIAGFMAGAGVEPRLWFFASFLVVMGLLGWLGTLKGWAPLVWTAAIILLALSILAALSIGILVAPAALLSLLSALLLSAAGRRPGGAS